MQIIAALCLLLSHVWAQVAAAPSPSPYADVNQFAGENSTACKLALIEAYGFSPGFGSRKSCATSVGTLQALMFFVDFSDNVAKDTTQSLYNFFVPQASEWYSNSSYGRLKLNVSADLTQFYRMPKPSSSYNWTRELTDAQLSGYIQDALASYTKTSGKTQFEPFDVLHIVPTANVVNPSFSPTWTDEVRTSAGARVAKAAVAFGADAFKKWKFKVLNHETGHAMCLPDLYRETPTPGGPSLHEYVGGFDLMGFISGVSPDYFAYHKWKLGWLLDSQVDCVTRRGTTTHTLSAIEAPGPGSKAVVVRRNSTAAVVAEVRSTLGNNADGCAPGVLLYTVSTATATGQIRVIDTTPNSGGCGYDMTRKELFNELNDAPLTAGRAFTIPGWNVKVNVTGQSGTSYTFTVEYS